jgi:glycosyltransferase involved in cell wall biosynthesis
VVAPILFVALAAVLLVWLRFARALVRMTAVPNLARAAPSLASDGSWPKLSVVVACRNEASGIRAALSSLLAQDYPALEVVAVDDRSEDATGTILDELAVAHRALRVVHLTELPAGWLGKTNALARGAAAASGEWILFTDADVVFGPDALRRAVAWALRDGLGHAVAMPHFVAPGLLERAFVSLFGMFLLIHLEVHELGRPGSTAHLGIGAFNLVRRDAYEAIGGHERLRLEVADDVKLGLVLRRSGVRQGCADSGGLVRVRWQRGFFASMRGLVKNFFAGSEYRWAGVLRSAIGVPLVTALPAACLFLPVSPAARFLSAAAFGFSAALLGLAARRLAGGRGYEGLLLPIAGLGLAAVALASAVVTTWRGGVVWRGTRYGLDELRAHAVRDADWPADRAPAWNPRR